MSQLLFVHLAKTGGTSVRRILKASALSFDCVHHHTLLRFQGGQRVERKRFSAWELGPYPLAFLMVRHPLQRLISCYRYFLAGGLNARPGDAVFPADQQLQAFLKDLAPSLEQCCQQLPAIAERIPHVQPLSVWLDALPNPLADRVFTGRQEQFERDLQQLFEQLGVPLDPTLLQRSNSTASIAGATPVLSADALAMVQSFYAEDFRRFGYSLESPGLER